MEQFRRWLAEQKGIRPVALYDPIADFFEEGYVKCPVAMTEETVEFFPHNHDNRPMRIVPVARLVPTARKLKGKHAADIPTRDLEPTEGTVVGVLLHAPGFTQRELTEKELEAGLGRHVDRELQEAIAAGRICEGTKRKCAITGEISTTYKICTPGLSLSPAANIEELQAQYAGCKACPLGIERLRRQVKNPVFGRGSPAARGLIIGEAPGRIEEETGIAFHPSAPAGKILYRAMSFAGLDQRDWFIDNAVACRPLPPDPESKEENGKPTAEELQACNSRLKALVYILQPKVVVLLGSYAYAAWFGHHPQRLSGLLGWQGAGNPRIYVAYHPAYYVRRAARMKTKHEKAALARSYVDQWKEIAEVFYGGE